MNENTYSPNHPHGPPSKEMIDNDGRCLWCHDLVTLDQERAARQRIEASHRGLLIYGYLIAETSQEDEDDEQPCRNCGTTLHDLGCPIPQFRDAVSRGKTLDRELAEALAPRSEASR